MKSNIENCFDDPFGSPYLRGLDQVNLLALQNKTERRIDISLSELDLLPCFLYNRITGDERQLYQKTFYFVDKNTQELIDAKYSETR